MTGRTSTADADRHGGRDGGRHGEDRRLARVDDRAELLDAEHAQVRDRERAAGQVVDRRRSVAGRGGEGRRPVVDLVARSAVSASRMTGTTRPAGTDTAMPRWTRRRGQTEVPVGPGVDVRELGEGVRGRGEHEVGHREVRAGGLELAHGARAACVTSTATVTVKCGVVVQLVVRRSAMTRRMRDIWRGCSSPPPAWRGGRGRRRRRQRAATTRPPRSPPGRRARRSGRRGRCP